MSLVVWLPLINNIENQGTKNLPVPTVNAMTKNTTYGKLSSSSMNGNLMWHLSEEILGNTWSVCTWINSSYFNQYNNIIFCKNIKDSTDCQIYFSIINNNQLNVGVNGSMYSLAYTSQTFALNTWYHVAATYDGSKVSLYINGVRVGSGTVSTAMPVGRLNIGVNCRSTNDAGTTVTGASYRYNDFRLYDHALSPREVKDLSRGLVAHYPLNNNGEGGINICPDTSSKEVQYTYPASSFKDQFSKTTTIIPSASKYTLSFYAKSTVNGDQVRAHYYNPNTTTTCESSQGIVKTASDGNMDFTLSTEWKRYWVTYTQTETTAVKHIIFPRMFSQSYSGTGGKGTGIVSVRCVKMEEGDHPTAWNDGSSQTIVYDMSGYCNNGTINGSLTYPEDCPRYSLSTKFVDNNSRIRVQIATSGFTNSYTFSWWGKYTNYTSHMMWGFGDGNRLNLYMSSGNFYWNTGDGANNPFNVSAATYGDNQWHYFAVTGDGTTAKLYIDGEFKANAKTYKGITGTVLFFNGWDTGTNYKFNGNLSDFRLYATPLSAEDILELYHTSASVSDNGTLFAYTFNEE